jgi:monoterpene epsilon-lactone hydrolase
MRGYARRLALGVIAISLMLSQGSAQQAPADRRLTDSSTIAPDGTAYVTRVVPVPTTISPEAQTVLARVESDTAVPQTLEQRRTGTDKWQAGAGEASKKLYPVNVTADSIAGVPVRVVTHHNAGKARPCADQPPWRWLQFRFRLADGVHPYRQPYPS